VLVNAVMNMRVPQKAVNFSTSWESGSFSRKDSVRWRYLEHTNIHTYSKEQSAFREANWFCS
jgi:hypothetical protein